MELRHSGFTIVELVIVMLLLGILAATALPRFTDSTERARSAHAQYVAGAFAAAVTHLRVQWMAESKPSSIAVDGTTVVFTDGWQHSSSLTSVECAQLWERLFSGATPIETYVANTPPPHWSALGFGGACFFIYQNGQILSGSNLLPLFRYRPLNGAPEILRYYM